VTFAAAAIGSLPLSWQWFLNEAPIPDATNAVLALTNCDGGEMRNLLSRS
jgi:hypothetical protein